MVADFLWDLEIAIIISSVFEFQVPVHDRSRDIRYRSRYLQLLPVSSFRRTGLADPCSGLHGKFLWFPCTARVNVITISRSPHLFLGEFLSLLTKRFGTLAADTRLLPRAKTKPITDLKTKTKFS